MFRRPRGHYFTDVELGETATPSGTNNSIGSVTPRKSAACCMRSQYRGGIAPDLFRHCRTVTSRNRISSAMAFADGHAAKIVSIGVMR